MTIEEIKHYTEKIIPNIEREIGSKEKTPAELLELVNLYTDVLRIVAPWDFKIYNKFLELDEDHTDSTKAFYHHRQHHLDEVFTAFNEMEVEDKYDILLISLPPRVGKTTTGIRFLSWIMGRFPEQTELAVSYSDNITSSFYIGVMEIVQSQRFKEVFPEATLVSQNAKREEIWLKVAKRYPSITFVPINGSMTGRCEAGKYLYCDDLVSGLEEALSITRLDKLWGTYSVNCKQRKLEGCKEIHVATRWSVHDVITRLGTEKADNPRVKIINVPCYDENGESQFDYVGGFSTAYYKELEDTMDELSFNAIYRQEPVEREGLLYHKEDMKYYFSLPNEKPDSIVAICDSKNMGKDYVASLIGYVYGDTVYIEDVVYNNGLPEVTIPLVANKWREHNVVRGDIEMNNGGNYYAENVDTKIKGLGGKTSVRMFFTGNNKQVKIITYSDYVIKHFIFKDKSLYSSHSEYAMFMKDLFSWTQMGKNYHDDAPDATAMMAQLVQELTTCSIKIMDRRLLGI